MSLTINASWIESIAGGRDKRLDVVVGGADINRILEEIGIDEIVKQLDTGELLDAIGQKAAQEYFGLVEPD